MEIHNSDSFSEAFDFASGVTGSRFQNPLWQITEPVFGRRFRHSISIVKKFGTLIVTNAVKSRDNTRKTNETASHPDQKPLDSVKGSLINSLLDSIDDEEMVADAALNYLSAGKIGPQVLNFNLLTLHR